MKKELCFSEGEGSLTVALPSEIDHHSAAPIREEIDKRLFLLSPSLLALDFSRVSFMDSSGIGLILGRSEVCSEIGCRIRLLGLSPSLMKIVRLSGIEKIKNISISDL